MNFFDRFDRFYTTSETSPFPHRLNGRHQAIIQRNASILAGRKVLDIASHDGRWTFAALKAGAAHVTGIEPRQELINNASESFKYYNINSSQFDFICGDVFNVLQSQHFDIVLCLGFFYHTARHAELIDLIERTTAQFVVIDSEVTPSLDEMPITPNDQPRIIYNNPYSVQFFRDEVDKQQMACHDSLTRNGYTLVARPSRAATHFFAEHFGYNCEMYNWKEHFINQPAHKEFMPDYFNGWRETFYLTK